VAARHVPLPAYQEAEAAPRLPQRVRPRQHLRVGGRGSRAGGMPSSRPHGSATAQGLAEVTCPTSPPPSASCSDRDVHPPLRASRHACYRRRICHARAAPRPRSGHPVFDKTVSVPCTAQRRRLGSTPTCCSSWAGRCGLARETSRGSRRPCIADGLTARGAAGGRDANAARAPLNSATRAPRCDARGAGSSGYGRSCGSRWRSRPGASTVGSQCHGTMGARKSDAPTVAPDSGSRSTCGA
jgi:hypothetical protein